MADWFLGLCTGPNWFVIVQTSTGREEFCFVHEDEAKTFIDRQVSTLPDAKLWLEHRFREQVVLTKEEMERMRQKCKS